MRFSPVHFLGIGLILLSVGCAPSVGSPPAEDEGFSSAELADLHNEIIQLAHQHDHLTGHRSALAENLSAAAREVSRRRGRPELDPGRAEISRILSEMRPTVGRVFMHLEAAGPGAIPQFLQGEGVEWDASTQRKFEAVFAASDEFWNRHPRWNPSLRALGREADPEDDNNDLKIRTADAAGGTVATLAGYPWLAPLAGAGASLIAQEMLEGEDESALGGCCNCPASCTGGTDP